MSFQGSSKRLAVTLRHIRQVMPCSVPPVELGAYAEYLGCQGGGHRKETIQPLL